MQHLSDFFVSTAAELLEKFILILDSGQSFSFAASVVDLSCCSESYFAVSQGQANPSEVLGFGPDSEVIGLHFDLISKVFTS